MTGLIYPRIAALFLLLASTTALAAESRSYHHMTTGNGHGFQIFDTRTHQLTAFLEHPYRYTKAPLEEWDYGPERRNLLQEMRFGIMNPDTEWLSADEWRKRASDSYLEQTNIVHSQVNTKTAYVATDYFSPFGLERNAMVAMMSLVPKRRSQTPAQAVVQLDFHLGGIPRSEDIFKAPMDVVKLAGERVFELAESEAWVETGNGKGAMLYLPITPDVELECVVAGNPETSPWQQVPAPAVSICDGEEVGLRLRGPWDDETFGVLIVYIEDPLAAPAEARRLRAWLNDRTPGELLHASLAEWRKWRKPPPVAFRDSREERLWRQSEAILRMSQVREKHPLKSNHGMVLASLGPGNWSTGWVRDATYATVALARMGHYQEAKESLRFFLNAKPVGKYRAYVSNADYRISVTRYFGDGEEEADYSGATSPNIEMDGWGLFLWAARQYIDASGDFLWLNEYTRSGTVYEAIRDGVAEAIEQNLETLPVGRVMKPDSSSWEVHWDNRKHFAFTTLTAARGICDFASIAKRSGHFTDAKKFAVMAREIQNGLVSGFGSGGSIRNTLELGTTPDRDAAVVEAIALDVLPQPRSPVALQTIADLMSLRSPAGGFRRDNGIDPYAADDWVFVDLRMANALRRHGDLANANALIDMVVARANQHFDQIPETYNVNTGLGHVGAYTGSIPMVGYGGGAYVLSLLDRDGHFEHRDCGL